MSLFLTASATTPAIASMGMQAGAMQQMGPRGPQMQQMGPSGPQMQMPGGPGQGPSGPGMNGQNPSGPQMQPMGPVMNMQNGSRPQSGPQSGSQSLKDDGNYGITYPYANLAADSQIDPWGFWVRECVSYVAWKRRAEHRAPYPNQWGNAADWVKFAPTTNSPSVGAMAIWGVGVDGAGWAGHVAYVEGVNSDGTIKVSEYNHKPHEFGVRDHQSTAGLKFIK